MLQNMTKQDWAEVILFSGFRLLAAGVFLVGAFSLIFQLAESWFQFDPNYLGSFFLSTLFRPLVWILAAIILHCLAGFLARTMARSFKQPS